MISLATSSGSFCAAAMNLNESHCSECMIGASVSIASVSSLPASRAELSDLLRRLDQQVRNHKLPHLFRRQPMAHHLLKRPVPHPSGHQFHSQPRRKLVDRVEVGGYTCTVVSNKAAMSVSLCLILDISSTGLFPLKQAGPPFADTVKKPTYSSRIGFGCKTREIAADSLHCWKFFR